MSTTTTTRDACPDPELLTALVDSELDRTEQDLVLDHISGCADCAADLAAERRTRAVLVALRGESDHGDGAGDDALAPSADLTARLLAIPASDGREAAPVHAIRPRRAPAYLGAAASVVVLMVGAFAFIGASTQDGGSPSSPSRTTAIVPAADSLAQEHAATTVQTGLGGAGISAVTVSLPQSAPVLAP